jgi:hypothetical protein
VGTASRLLSHANAGRDTSTRCYAAVERYTVFGHLSLRADYDVTIMNVVFYSGFLRLTT